MLAITSTLYRFNVATFCNYILIISCFMYYVTRNTYSYLPLDNSLLCILIISLFTVFIAVCRYKSLLLCTGSRLVFTKKANKPSK